MTTIYKDKAGQIACARSRPHAAVLEAVRGKSFDVDHVFGITEISGTPVSCAWQSEWDELLADPDSIMPVAQDGVASGEILVRGNTKAFEGGRFHTGMLPSSILMAICRSPIAQRTSSFLAGRISRR